jgi:hypothetical protein
MPLLHTHPFLPPHPALLPFNLSFQAKHAHRGLDGTYRTAAEMERHRAQLADAAIEEQLEVQTALREQGAKLQAIYERKQRGEFEMAKRWVRRVRRVAGLGGK